jgi:hypothetical protein
MSGSVAFWFWIILGLFSGLLFQTLAMPFALPKKYFRNDN